MLLLMPVLMLALAAPAARAQRPDSVRAAAGVRVSGVVRDTLARAPLAGALVQLAPYDTGSTVNRSAQTDSLGRFAIDDVPAGRYLVGFLHPLLDSLGLQAPTVDLRVARRPVRIDLATPSASMLRGAMCGMALSGASGALLMGVVRDARDGTPVSGAVVTGEWVEFILTGTRLSRRQPAVRAATGEQGTFALCGVPAAGSIFVRAQHGSDSTDVLELRAAADGLLRQDLYLGTSPAQLSGLVFTAEGSVPVAGATVGLVGGPQTRSDARGAWTLVDAPGGTRMLEVRAIGYYPERRPVDVVAGARSVRVALLTFQAVLDTVRVVASRVGDLSGGGFDARRRSSLGNFLTEEDIARRGGAWTSDLFRSIPGVRLDGSGIDRRILIRNGFGDACPPSLFVDGLYLFEPTADELDAIVTPARIRGIEVYTDASTPAEFQRPGQGMRLGVSSDPASPIEARRSATGCGAIVIWTKTRPPRVP